MLQYRQKIANFGENLAVNYLLKNGYKIIDRNKKIGYKEIDIIANIKEKIVFIEVKTRTNEVFGQASEAFNREKLKNIKIAMENYFFDHNLDIEQSGIDLIAIDIDCQKKMAKIRHFKAII